MNCWKNIIVIVRLIIPIEEKKLSALRSKHYLNTLTAKTLSRSDRLEDHLFHVRTIILLFPIRRTKILACNLHVETAFLRISSLLLRHKKKETDRRNM